MKLRLQSGILLAGIIALPVLLGTRSETYAQAQGDAAVARQLAGVWRLVSWPLRLADGTTRQNPKTVSYLIYTDNGYMCWEGMNPNRAQWGSASMPTPAEMKSSLGIDFNAYCGKVEIYAKEGFILHHVEIDKSPNYVGMARKRWFTFEGPNRVSLRVDPSENDPPVVESTLIWERIPQ